MPKLERLEWVAPLSAGKGVTLSDDEAADRFLEENSFALLLGVLYDSQYQTRRAFSSPYRLWQRLGHLDPGLIATMEDEPLLQAFREKPALHRFPNRYALLTRQVAGVVVSEYGGDADRIWLEAEDAPALGTRLMALPAFGRQKTDWTVGMLGRMGVLSFSDWEDFRV